MHASKRQSAIYETIFSSLASKSEREIEKEIRKYDETKVKRLYLQILIEIKEAVSVDNIECFQNVEKIISVLIKTQNKIALKSYYKSEENPIIGTNLIILACKQNAVNILEYMFSNKSKILDNLSTAIEISVMLPTSQDDECHDSFYYAIGSNNAELLETLITKWPDNYFDSHLDELDEILSIAYEEIKLKNMLLSDEMELFVESRLIDLRFFSKDFSNVKCAKSSLNNIKERMGLVLENINMLTAEYSDMKEIDGTFLVAAKFIARNIHILKRQLKPTYNRIPWEEMEFCLTVFVRSKIADNDLNLMCNFILPTKRILMHLENFAIKLNEIKISKVDVNKKIPCSKRETIVSTIIRDYPPFGELYKDYTKVADLNSLDKISNYLDLALMANPEQEGDRLVIVRALQVTGEYLKSTLESPKLSVTTSELLLLSVPKNTSEILTDLRNSLAHADPFSKWTEMEENFFINIQNDLKKIGTIVIDMLYKSKIKTCRIILKSIIGSESLEEIQQLAEGFGSFKLQKPVLGNFETSENKQLKDLIEELSFIVYEKTEYEKSLFKKINDIFCADEISRNENLDCTMMIAMLDGIKFQLRCSKFDQNGVRVIKSCAMTALETLSPKMKPSSLKEIAEIVLEIAGLLKPRLESECVNEVNRIILQIFHVTQYESDNVKWIEQLQEKVTKNKFAKFCPSTESRQTKNIGIPQENWKNQLSKKLSMLESILNDTALNCQIVENYLSYKSNRKLQTTVEMLIQDIMSILESSSQCLTDNLLFLDDNAPLLNGRSLRNHLAHGNALLEGLLFDPSTAIILNARKLVSEDVINNKKYIGKLVKDLPLHQRKKHEHNLQAVINQEAMFTALEEGNLEDLKSYVKKGADINARSIKLWTALHFAAKGPSLEVVKFVFSQNLIATDVDGQNPLHIAAAYGQTCNVEFFVSQKGFNMNDADNYCQTPLHLAAQNGHRGVVEILLNKGANTAKKDIIGRLAIHYAVINNYKDITVILLQKQGNGNSEIMGGYSLLHIAAENGHLEILHFLLQTKENVNGKNDRNWTPLHAAALNGHLEVVKTLISYGANTNAKILTDSCTPLHYAIENGHENIVEILLQHGACVNAADKIYNNVPLHYAAQSGYLKIVKILLENKADVDIPTANGMTSLHFAACYGHEEIVKLLLKQKASINIKDNHGTTALHFSGNKNIAELLIENGTSVHSTDENDRTPLHYASMCGNKEVVELLIAERAVIDFRDLQGCTALHLCSINGCTDVMDVLIKKGANINAEDYDGNTALHFISGACFNERTAEFIFKHVRESIFKPKHDIHEIKKILQVDDTDFSVRSKTQKVGEVVKLLLDNNANTNAKCKGNITPLHLAALNGNVEILEALIKGKANVNIRTVDGCTPLHMATLGNHKKIMDILIRNGAEVNSESDSGPSPLFLAIKYNYKDIVKLLIRKGADVNTKGSLSYAILGGFKDIAEILLKNKNVNIHASCDETLHIAAKKGLRSIVEALITKGANVNAVTDDGLRPLHIAAQEGHKDVVELLLAKGANINSTCIDGTPLHLAAPKGHNEVVKVLLHHRANVHIKDIKNRTALGLAVAHGCLQVVKTLLKYMDVNRTMEGIDRWPVLHVASPEGDLEMIKCLIDAGADIHAKNMVGTKAIHLAAREGHKDVVEFFLNRGCHINDRGVADSTLLHYAVMGGQLEMTKYLINLNIDVNATNCYNSTPIHIAASFDSENVVRLLLSNGAIYDGVNKFNQKPLDRAVTESIITLFASTEKLFKAVRCGNTSEIENHIKTGAFINAKNHQRIMPLHFAAWKGYKEVVGVLLRHQANPNAIGKGGCSPLHYAAKFGHLRIVKRLLSSGAVYNIVSDNFKTPLDFSEHQAIIDLLKLVARFFEKIQNGDPEVVDDLKQVTDIDTIKVVMNACNKKNETLIVAAVHNDFPKMEKLKEVVLGDQRMAIEMANKLLMQEKYRDALNIFRNVHKKMEDLLGSDNPCTLDIQNHVAKAVYGEKKYLEALPLFEEIYEKRKKILGPNNRHTICTRSLVALVLFRLGKNEEALEFYQEICKKQKEILGENDQDTLDSQFHMALVLGAAKRFEEALIINYEVFNKRKQTFGINHLLTLAAQNNIAMVLGYQGKYEEAIKVYKQVYEKRKKVLGPFHSASLKVLNNIAVVYLQEEKYDDALKTYQEVFDLQKKNLGSDCFDTWFTRYNIGNIFFQQGKWVQALKIYKEGLHQGKVILGSKHPFILDVLSKLEAINLRLKFDDYDDSSDVFKFIQKDIFIAANNGDAKGIQDLLDEGIDVNAKDAEGRTPLHFVANNGHKDTVYILLKNGADASIASDKGNTPLHTATSRGHQEIVEMLLRHVEHENLNKLSNFVNAQTTGSGSTSLHIACKNGFFEIAKCLLKHGAAYNCTDKCNNKTPIDYSENQNITDLLNAVDELFESESTEIIRKLEKMPPDEFQAIVNARNNEGKKSIHLINNSHKNE